MLRVGPHAAEACEPRQVRKKAAVNSVFRVPWNNLIRVYLQKNVSIVARREGHGPKKQHVNLELFKFQMEKASIAKKHLGQHFLYDQRVLRRIVNACDLNQQDSVLEVGPGRGHLTGFLAETGANVTAVEIDPDLFNGPLQGFNAYPNVDVRLGDVRDMELGQLFQSPFSYKFVANLPYNSGTNILRYVICRRIRPSRAVVMLQKEVAQNIISGSGRRGILAVLFQTFATGRLLFTVPPSAFRPKPKVTSAVISLDCLREDLIPEDMLENYFKVIIAGFSTPRKQLHNSLSNGLHTDSSLVVDILEDCQIDHTRRPSSLEVSEWITIFNYLTQCALKDINLFFSDEPND